jgi:outer membrane protein OmpA-like peptidoglycan-associated protein
MRFFIAAIVLCASALAPAAAQTVEEEMSRAESELRDTMAPAGVTIERTAPDEIRLRMPSDITFAFNRADVRRAFIPRVNDLARTLNAYPFMSIAIIGHADAIGSDAYNQTLSERRARSVAALLADFGVPRRRMETSGLGEWSPIASNADEWGRAQNRRVEIRLSAKRK